MADFRAPQCWDHHRSLDILLHFGNQTQRERFARRERLEGVIQGLRNDALGNTIVCPMRSYLIGLQHELIFNETQREQAQYDGLD